jgi:hypothetical protein
MSERRKYDFERLDKYCKENNVTLLEDYSCCKLTKDYIITGLCIYENCKNNFEKKLENLIKTGSYCKNCTKLMMVKKTKQIFLEKYGSENILHLDFVKEKTNPNKFTYQKLKEYCCENNIELMGEYDNCHLTKKTLITAKCQSIDCQEIVNKNFRCIEKRGVYCKNCMNNIKQKKTIETCMKKYGVPSSSACKEVQEKTKKTNKERYGTEFSFQSDDVKNKIKTTLLEKYGVENPTQNEDIKNKIKQRNLEKYGFVNPLHSTIIKEKVKKSMIQKYGVENASQNQDIKDKKIKTSFKNWGVKYPSQNQTIQEKIKQTNLINLGVEYPTQNIDVKNKIKQKCLEKYGVEYSWQSQHIKNKIKETNLIKLGVEYPSQSKEIENKKIKTSFKNWGVKHPSQNQIIRTKTKETNLIKYNCECPLQNEDIKNKSIVTNLIKYGVNYPLQNSEIMEKQIKSSYSKKEYIFPSGKLENIQGYEKYALDELIINEKIDETDIIIGVKNVPEIWYIGENNVKHRHYVDIFIPSQNKCIEVKSLYTYNKNKKINILKSEAAKKSGFIYEFWIYNNKGNKIQIYDDKSFQ